MEEHFTAIYEADDFKISRLVFLDRRPIPHRPLVLSLHSLMERQNTPQIIKSDQWTALKSHEIKILWLVCVLVCHKYCFCGTMQIFVQIKGYLIYLVWYALSKVPVSTGNTSTQDRNLLFMLAFTVYELSNMNHASKHVPLCVWKQLPVCKVRQRSSADFWPLSVCLLFISTVLRSN